MKRLGVEDSDVRPFAAFVRAGKPRCGPLRERQKNIFDRDGDLVSSAAFVPLGADKPIGFLIVGSRDPDHFHPGKRRSARRGAVARAAITWVEPSWPRFCRGS